MDQMLFKVALAVWFIAWLVGAGFSFRLRLLHPEVFREIESPPANTWYPVWVFRLLAPSKLRRLGAEGKTWMWCLVALIIFAATCTLIVAASALGVMS